MEPKDGVAKHRFGQDLRPWKWLLEDGLGTRVHMIFSYFYWAQFLPDSNLVLPDVSRLKYTKYWAKILFKLCIIQFVQLRLSYIRVFALKKD